MISCTSSRLSWPIELDLGLSVETQRPSCAGPTIPPREKRIARPVQGAKVIWPCCTIIALKLHVTIPLIFKVCLSFLFPFFRFTSFPLFPSCLLHLLELITFDFSIFIIHSMWTVLLHFLPPTSTIIWPSVVLRLLKISYIWTSSRACSLVERIPRINLCSINLFKITANCTAKKNRILSKWIFEEVTR